MTIALPVPLAAYFAAASAQDTDALLACFTEDARVHDEGKDRIGQAAIREWSDWANETYNARYTPLSSEIVDGNTIVATEVAGDFKGSPAVLRFAFGLDDGKIVTLSIG